MKIRNGFVSNSSSSSFCIVGDTFNLIDLVSKIAPKKYKNEIQKYIESDDCYEIYEFLDNHSKELFPENFNIFYACDNDFCWLGIDLEIADENKSIKELKEEMKKYCKENKLEADDIGIIVETISDY